MLGATRGSAAMSVRVLAPLLTCFCLIGCTGTGSTSDRADGGPSAASPSVETSHVDATYSSAWLDVTDTALGPTADWTNKVEAADIDTDGDVDLLFANGGDYDRPGKPVANRVFLNGGDGTFTDMTRQVFGKAVGLTRVIKVADVNADTVPDIVVGTAFSTHRADSGWATAVAVGRTSPLATCPRPGSASATSRSVTSTLTATSTWCWPTGVKARR
jgi:hypothetical protein